MTDQPTTPIVNPPEKSGQQDPSPLVTQMVQREISQLQDLVEAKMDGRIAAIVARLDAMDKALELFSTFPTEMQRTVQQLKELHEEKFSSIHQLLRELDHRAMLLSEAQKEARDKRDMSLTKQLDALESQIATVTRSLDSKIDDLKTRITAMEGRM